MGLSFSVRIEGQDDILARVEMDVQNRMQQADNAVQSAGLLCEALAKAACPVDTGNLKSSIHYENTGVGSCTVGTAVKYGPYVELGTSRQRAQPFLFPAYVEAGQRLVDALKA